MQQTPPIRSNNQIKKQTLKSVLQLQSEAGLVFGKKKKKKRMIVGGNWKILPHLSLHWCYHCRFCLKPATKYEPVRLKSLWLFKNLMI